MFPGTLLNAAPGERVLDLCAAPGGKTVQIAAGMKGEGLLVANDVSSQRIKALIKNIELCGIRNAIVTNESPNVLVQNFRGFFDKILVDAPCSGEGMFRKDGEAIRSWERFKCSECAHIQRDILEAANIMLREGGYLVYSTCTFSPEENEITISRFVENHQEYEIIDIPNIHGVESGRLDWCGGTPDIVKTARLWPHKVRGEGHFAALLKKKGKIETHSITDKYDRNIKDMDLGSKYNSMLKSFREFEKENLNIKVNGRFNIRGNYLFILPGDTPDMRGIRVSKPGWLIGTFKGNRFEPSHSLALSLKRDDFKNPIDFKSDSREILSYLKGETIMIRGPKGLTAVCVDGYPVGWAKQMGEYLKNLYPSGWRKMV
jgi:NOL1/NOP2/fmu family ribosome biogenesis protein/23S rRNA U2552 (ribose-2'-O)-methylase RlmE/FtsJ